jgi:release factor glutamine methyltransferase
MAAATWRQLLGKTIEVLGEPAAARWLLEQASGLSAARLITDLDDEAPPAAVERLSSMLQRCASGEPLQYVLGHWGFRELDVLVDRRVLVPRPETEFVVGIALLELDRATLLANRARELTVVPREPTGGAELLVADLGTGSGVIALSVVTEREGVRVVASERDQDALDVARANLAALGAGMAARVLLCQGDWYQALPIDLMGRFDMIVTNPPYVAQDEWGGLEAKVRDYEPYGALVPGPTGLEAIEEIVAGAPTWLNSTGVLVVELAPCQAQAATALAKGAGLCEVRVESDLVGRPRALVARR